MINNIKSSITNTLIYGIGNLTTKIIGFILIPVYVKHFSISTYGVLGLLEVTNAALVSILGLAFTQALYRWYWDEAFITKRKSIFFTTLSFLIVFLSFVIFISYFFIKDFSSLLFGEINYYNLIFLVIITSSLQIITQTISTLIQLQQKAILFTVANVLTLIIQLLFTIYFITLKNIGLYGIYYAQIISFCFYLIIVSYFLIKNIELKFEILILKRMLAYSSPWLISNVAALIISISDRYFIRVFGEMGDLGIYQFGYKIANTVSVLVIASAQMAIFPMMFKKMNDPDAKRFYSKIMTYFTFGVMFFILFLNFYSFEIIKFLARKKEYWDAYGVIPYISLGLIFAMLKDLTSVPLQIAKKSTLVSKIIIFSAIVSLGLNWLIIPRYGSLGAAISFIISQFFYFILMTYFAQKNYKINYEFVKVIKMIVVGIILFFISLALADFSLPIRMISKIILIISFPVILYFLNFYEKIELESMKGFWKKWRHLSNIKSNLQELTKGKNI